MNKKISITLLLALFSQISFASVVDTKNITTNIKDLSIENNITQTNILDQNKKITLTEKIKILLDEKNRLKKVEDRRLNKDQIQLGYMYINETKYNNNQKGLLREALYYMDLIKTNYNKPEILKPEINNIILNSACINYQLKEDSEIVYSMLDLSINDNTTTTEDKNFDAGKKLMSSLIIKNGKQYSTNELKIRCLDIYKERN